MVFRTKAQIGPFLILMCGLSSAATGQQTFPARHRHLRGGAPGILRVTDDGIAFQEESEHHDHSRQWRFADIEQFTLGADELRILTYENAKLGFGRDREFVFDRLPKDFAVQLYPVLSQRLDQRFVAAIADDGVKPIWQAPAKLLRWSGGPQGTILVGSREVVFRTGQPQASRTWRLGDIDLISSAGPFDLTITTFERDSANYAGRKDFHFILKRPLSDAEYNSLWTKLNQAKGLAVLSSDPLSKGEKQ